MRGTTNSFGCLAICSALFCFGADAPAAPRAEDAAGNKSPLFVTWRLVEGLGDNRFRSELTVRNHSQEQVSPPWSLFFNSSAKLAAGSVEPPLELLHVNGDFYELRAPAKFSPLAPGEERVVSLVGAPWAINVSDAPSGFYLVQVDDARNEVAPKIVPCEIEPFPESDKIRRGAGDEVPVVTAESRHAANAPLKLLPPDELPPVIPTPVHVVRLAGSVVIDGKTTIEVEPAVENEAQRLADSLSSAFDLKFQQRPQGQGGRNSIRLRLGSLIVGGEIKQSGDEAYSLRVAPNWGIEIVGTDPAGVFYGIQTLRGLIPLSAYQHARKSISIDAIEIADAPRFGYRGLHLDVARNFQSVETVKRLLERMAFYKLNRFHWHLSDDEGWRVEVRSLPELTTIGARRGHTRDEADRLVPSYGSGPFTDPGSTSGSGFYSQEEFIDVLRFAAARHIAVIPEIDVPGHSRAAVKAMAARARSAGANSGDLRLTEPGDESKYESVQAWNDNVIDVGRAESYEFVDTVIGEIADMYRRAEVPLLVVHLGGDEVPKGAWEGSPACRAIPAANPKFTRGQQLEVYFLKRACGIVTRHGATPAAWDDCLLIAVDDADWPSKPIAYVWNSVPGWGREDAAYRLANAGFDVVLSNATHLYFDLACEKDPLENGYYWAGFVTNRAPFDFNPLDSLQDVRTNPMGQSLAPEQFDDRVRLTPEGRERILGIQGQLWGENLRSAEQLDYMAFPRTIALAERAWAAEPAFANVADQAARTAARDEAWNQFANVLGQRELPRLHSIAGTVHYRIPPPGVRVQDGVADVNVAFPGLKVRYTRDSTEPDANSPLVDAPLEVMRRLKLRAFDASGHGSRSVEVLEAAE